MDRRRPESYSTVELARLLQVTVQTVQRWVDAGHLKAWKTVGGHRRIDAASVDAFRAASTNAAAVNAAAVNAAAGNASAGNALAGNSLAGNSLGTRAGGATQAAGTAGSTPVRVLVADDSPEDRELVGYLLRRLRPSWDVEFVDNGFAALLAIGRIRPDVLITDVAMPYLNGPAMLRTLYDAPEFSQMAVLAVSSHSSGEIEAMGGLPPGVEFLHKPLSKAEVERFLAGAEQKGSIGKPEGVQ